MSVLIPDWPAPASVKAYTTLKHDLWNIRYHTDSSEYAATNQQLFSILNLPTEPIWTQQNHTAIALEASQENGGQIADATFTRTANQVCLVLTADCLPILICERNAHGVAAIHAGWRGLAAGIIESALKGLNLPGQDLLAWLGPAISQAQFVVGEDVYCAFTDQNSQSALAFCSHPEQKNKWFANLYQLARIRLFEYGISEMYGGDFCTYTQNELFFSYRRDHEEKRRMASMIWITQR